jgi:sec-independent protein translocase protein TatA
MGFLGIGTGEILLILLLALIIWGPGRIPEIARTLGKTVRAFKKASFDLTTAVTREIEQSDEKSKPKETGQDKAGETPSEASKEPGEASKAK